MGTSAMTYVIVDGKTSIAALTSMDGYPSGAGKDLLGFISNKKNLQKLKEALPRCESVSQNVKDLIISRKLREDDYIERTPEYIYWGDARMLEQIIGSTGRVLIWNRFEERRFDNWAYVIDFDRNTFEVYIGMNKVPVAETERFYAPSGADEHGYYPLKEIAVFDLDDLPSTSDFKSVCDMHRNELRDA